MTRSSFHSTTTPLMLGFALSGLAAAQDISGLAFLPGDDAIGPAAGNQTRPIVSVGEDQTLVVWQDDRGSNSGLDIFAARLDSSGALLDSAPILVCQDAAEQSSPRAAWNGSHWLVSWESQLATQYYYSSGIQAKRISTTGVDLDLTPIPVVQTVSSGLMYSLSGNASGWLVVYQGTSAGDAATRGIRISDDGVVLDSVGRLLLQETYFLRFWIDVAFAADEYLLLWEEFSVVKARRYNLDLQALGSTFTVMDGVAPSLASNGDGFFVVVERDGYATSWVGGARISHTGTLLDPGGFQIADGAAYGPAPRAAWDGRQWFAAWSSLGAWVARVSEAGVVLDPGGVEVENAPASTIRECALAAVSGDGVQLVWTDSRTGGASPDDVYGARVDRHAASEPSSCVSVGSPRQTLARSVVDSTGTVLAFRSDVSGTSRVMVHKVDGNGAPLFDEPVLVAEGPSGSIGRPSIASTGGISLVVWSDGSDTIQGRRLLPDGSFMDPLPFAVMPGREADVAGAQDAESFLVVGTDAPVYFEFRHTFARRVRASDGALLDSAPIQVGQIYAIRPCVAVVGSRWLVAWESHATHDEVPCTVNAAFLTAGGQLSSEFVAASGFSAYHFEPALAGGPEMALLAWRDSRISNADWNIYARRILASGTMLDTGHLQLSTAPHDQGRPALAWDGTRFWAGWEDARAIPYFFDERTDVFATRVQSDGTVLDPSGITIADSNAPEIHPTVSGTGGRALLAASAWRGEDHQALRLAYRVTECPAPQNYCVGAPNSAGSGATMGSSGSTHVSENAFFLNAAGCPPGVASLFFYGPQASQSPFGNGFLCIAGAGIGLFRLGVIHTDGAGHATQQLRFDLPPASGGPGAIESGSVWNFQFWYRDPAGGGSLFNLSDGLRVTFCP